MNFSSIALKDKEIIDKYTKQKNYFLCEHCFTDIYIWRYRYSTKFCIENDFLFLRMKEPEEKKVFYLLPIGSGDLQKAICSIMEDAEKKGIPFIMISIPEELKSKVENLFPNMFDFEKNRDNEDYIYLAEDLMFLQGKKFHSKRNFINRFKLAFEGRWEYENLSSDNVKDVFDFQLKWYELNKGSHNNSYFAETSAIAVALKNFEKLGIKGGVLRLDGEVKAFTMGSELNSEVFVVQIEKADHTVPGAYQMINNLFAINNFEKYLYIDREEDLGLEGLRKAKLSYNPVKMGVNYNAVLKNKN